MYQVFLGYVPLPIAPSRIDTRVNSRNRTIELIDGQEVSILRDKGLTEISFDFLLPHQSYPFVSLAGGLSNAINDFLPTNLGNASMNTAILEYLEYLKTSKKPFQLVITRLGESGGKGGLSGVANQALNVINLYNATIKVSLESFSVTEDAGEHGMDFLVSVELKQYVPYSTKILKEDKTVVKTRP